MQQRGGRPRIKFNLAGYQITALVDTGSTHTLLDSALYPRLSPLESAPRVRSLTDQELPIKGQCTISILGTTTSVLVCERLEVDLLLGTDVCRQAILDFPAKRFIQATNNCQ